MKAACPRLFEVEALRDGRLSGAELARFRSHVEGCAVCADETRALAKLAEALKSSVNDVAADELHLRRERTRLLAAFDARLVPAAPSGRAKTWLGLVAVAAVLSAVGVFVLSRHSALPPALPALSTGPDPITIRADSSAQWSRQSEGQVDKIVLKTGTLSIHIDHAQSGRRLLVILPDGELEDIGTTFSVSTDAGHTTRVTVQSGTVVLRLHHSPALALAAGESWTPPVAPLLTLPTPSASPLAPAPPPTAASPFHGAKPTPSVAPLSSSEAPAPDTAADFRTAMSAFSGGDNARAIALFGVFLAQHPRDARAEDAAYLRILALQRANDSAGAHQAARDYLARYPRGFRRAEVEALSQ
jgi:hypothetical protein